jgi:hypothetical protein
MTILTAMNDFTLRVVAGSTTLSLAYVNSRCHAQENQRIESACVYTDTRTARAHTHTIVCVHTHLHTHTHTHKRTHKLL